MSLYNEVRPATISGIIGQDNVKAQISGALRSKKIPQSQIFVGQRGTGKTSLARVLAKAVNCEHPTEDGEPCNECETCKAIAAGSFVDVVEMDAASNNGVEDVQKIIENAAYTPMGKYKVFILDEVHMFSNAAWNSLLKTLEEPPKNVLFILCTTEEHKIPATIMSRCRKLYFEKIDLGLIAGYLGEVCEKYNKCFDADALKLIARASDGSMRDALSILEAFFDNDNILTETVSNALGISDSDAIFGILNAVADGNAAVAVKSFKDATKRGASLKCLVKSLIEAVSDAVFLLQGADKESVLNTGAYKDALETFSKKVNVERCLDLAHTLSDVYGNVSKTTDAAFLVEAALIRSINYVSELETLKKRVAALEAAPAVVAPVTAMQEPVTLPSSEPADIPLPPVEGINDEGFMSVDDECPFEEEAPVLTDSEDRNMPDNIINMPVAMDESVSGEDELLSILPTGTEVTGTISLFGESEQAEEIPESTTEPAGETEAVTEDFDSDLPDIEDLSGYL